MGDIQHLADAAAIKKIKDIAEGQTSMFCTFTGNAVLPRPMSTQTIDDDGSFWFFSHKESNKNKHIAQNPKVQLVYALDGKQEYLSLEGIATISTDKQKIDELWNGFLKTWFNDGKDDPNITLIRVAPTDGYYWDTKHNKMVSLVKIAAGAITGKTMDDGIEGKITV